MLQACPVSKLVRPKDGATKGGRRSSVSNNHRFAALTTWICASIENIYIQVGPAKFDFFDNLDVGIYAIDRVALGKRVV